MGTQLSDDGQARSWTRSTCESGARGLPCTSNGTLWDGGMVAIGYCGRPYAAAIHVSSQAGLDCTLFRTAEEAAMIGWSRRITRQVMYNAEAKKGAKRSYDGRDYTMQCHRQIKVSLALLRGSEGYGTR